MEFSLVPFSISTNPYSDIHLHFLHEPSSSQEPERANVLSTFSNSLMKEIKKFSKRRG
jgi:hypothetical protein